MVEFARGRGAAVRTALQRAGGQIHYEFGDLNVFAVSLPSAALQGIERNPNVVSVAPDVPRYLMAQTTPWGIDRVQAPQVWAAGATGTGVTVCVIDSGLYTGHEDIKGLNVIGGYPSDWSTDGCGHGTHVAGTIGALNNTTGVVGVSPGDVSLYIVKVFGDDCGWSYSSDLIDASQQCADAGADIISMSLGGAKGIGPWEKRQFDALYGQGILSIAAAGNDGDTSYSYPASYDSVVSVAATDVNDVVADFSQQNDQVELAAPGVGVLSTVPWIATNDLTVDGVSYSANHIDYAAYGSVSGALADGGLCDSVGSWSGQVVLCERGSISFYDKVINVQNGGGAAAILYNNEPGNFLGTLGEGYSSEIVALSISQEDGQYLVGNKLGFTADVASSISKPDSGYEAWNGTSMATPHVSAVAALLWSSDPTLTNADIRDAMDQTAFDLGASGRDNAYGYGLVQAYDAYTYLGGGTIDNPPTVSVTSPSEGDTVSGSVTVIADAVDDYGVSQVEFFVDGGSIGIDSDGSDGWSTSWDTTAYADGSSPTVSATATDTAGQIASDSVTVTVDNSGGSTGSTLYVAAITMSSKTAGPNRSAFATVTILDTDGNPVGSATVSGAWSGDYSGSVSGATDGAGQVTFESGKVRQAGATFTFTVTDVAKSGFTYDGSLNVKTEDTITVQ
jgi:subtilisin family serine protease